MNLIVLVQINTHLSINVYVFKNHLFGNRKKNWKYKKMLAHDWFANVLMLYKSYKKF